MYYDLIASLPHLPHFEHAERLPTTRLRLDQRLRLLTPDHGDQLARARALVGWRPDRWLGRRDAALVAEYAAAVHLPWERPLWEYVALRADQQTILAALRRKKQGRGLPDAATRWGFGQRARYIERHWDAPDLGLAHLYPWLPQARELLAAGAARDLERLLMGVAWRWLDRCAEQDMFGFEAVFSYAFQWDILQAWLSCDADQGKTRFRDLVDKVTHVEHS